MGVADERIRLVWDTHEMRASAELREDAEMQTAVMISVHTDGLVSEDDNGVTKGDDRRGWWADHLAERNIGSKGWRRWRTPFTSALLRQEEQDTRDALAWLIDDGVASRIDVVATRIAPDRMQVHTDIYRPGDNAPRWRFAWENTVAT